MVAANPTAVVYPTSNGEPLAETQEHVWVILLTLNLLSQYLRDREAVVFANPFLYYIEGNPRARVAPDVMVVFDIPAGLRGNYKIWAEGQTPAIIFEMTSASTRTHDWDFKKTLYAQLGIQEYWLFDPYGDWIEGQLQGYCLDDTHIDVYRPITNTESAVLGLKLGPNGYVIDFFRLDTGAKLLTPDELLEGMQQSQQELEAERKRAERLAAKLRELGVEDLD